MIDQAGFMMEKGKQIACERIQGVNDNMLKSHYHDYFELYFLEYGQRYHMIQNQLYCITSKEFIVLPPHVMHHSYSDDDMPFKRLLLYFSPESVLFPEVLETLRPAASVFRTDSRTSQDIHHLLNEILKEQEHQEHFFQESLTMLLNQLLIKVTRCNKVILEPQENLRITTILRYIHQHYTEDLALNDLSKTFYLSQFHLCREFKKYTNSTIVQYINHLRIIHAKRLLSETDKTVTDVSKLVGFSSLSHFGRTFKAITGVAPTKWKDSC